MSTQLGTPFISNSPSKDDGGRHANHASFLSRNSMIDSIVASATDKQLNGLWHSMDTIHWFPFQM